MKMVFIIPVKKSAIKLLLEENQSVVLLRVKSDMRNN